MKNEMKGKHRTKKGGNQDFLEKNAGGETT